MVFQNYSVGSVTKTFTFKGVQTIHRSIFLHALKCKLFVTLATM
jgi:hypothetical protein